MKSASQIVIEKLPKPSFSGLNNASKEQVRSALKEQLKHYINFYAQKVIDKDKG